MREHQADEDRDDKQQAAASDDGKLSAKQDQKKQERFDTSNEENPLICRGTD